MKKNESVEKRRKSDLTGKELKQRIIQKLSAKGINNLDGISDIQLYTACYSVLKDIMLCNRERFALRARAEGSKKICYFSYSCIKGIRLSDSIC
jgi:hypothetical protein